MATVRTPALAAIQSFAGDRFYNDEPPTMGHFKYRRLGEKRRKRESQQGAVLKVTKATLLVAVLTLLATIILAD